MCTQHGLETKGWSAGAPFGVVGCDQLDQRCPGHDLIHLLQKLAFAGSLEVQVQAEVCLFHEKGSSQIWLTDGTNFWDLCRVSLEFQQNLAKLPLSVVVLVVRKNRVQDLEPLLLELAALFLDSARTAESGCRW